jgi:hypothetical protein
LRGVLPAPPFRVATSVGSDVTQQTACPVVYGPFIFGVLVVLYWFMELGLFGSCANLVHALIGSCAYLVHALGMVGFHRVSFIFHAEQQPQCNGKEDLFAQNEA